MKKKLIWLTCFMIVFVLMTTELKDRMDPSLSQETFSNQSFVYGAKGADVKELQGRLKYLGFYYGGVDGDYGYRTLRSTKWFQGEFGLEIDGVVGPKTKLKLWEATKDWKPTEADTSQAVSNAGETGTSPTDEAQPADVTPSNNRGFSKNDMDLMANAVYGEARGEPFEGQVAVAAVILNRLDSQTFPNTISGVIFEPRAFTAVADGQIYMDPDDTARKAVQEAINGLDPSDGCTYYFNPDTATSGWIWTRPQYKTIGKHIFCR